MYYLVCVQAVILIVIVINLILNVWVMFECLMLTGRKNSEIPNLFDETILMETVLGNITMVMRIIDFHFKPKYII
jgi:hypothetical protein